MWACRECGAQNQNNVYRCCVCDKIKPYDMIPARSCSSPQSLRSSSTKDADDHWLTASAYETTRSDSLSAGVAARLATSGGYQRNLWGGGARPKSQDPPRVLFEKLSVSEDQQPLLAEDTSDRRTGCFERSERQRERDEISDHTPGRSKYRTGSSDSFTELDFPDEKCRLVLIGRTGNGKSSAGNTILGMKRFQEGGGFISETSHCQMHTADRFGIPVQVVDTPGFFDNRTPDDQLFEEIRRCIGMVSPGPHGLLLVIGGRFTDEQLEAVQQMRALFGEKVIDHVLVIFTFGDRLSPGQGEGRCRDVIKENLQLAPQELRDLIERDLNSRYVVFNNVGTLGVKERQVRELLLMVGEITRNRGGPFAAPLLEDCKDIVCTFENRILALLNSR
ncbi:GTPase IMAP family member 4-like isoform X2 [Babylonia areolata]